MKIISLAHELSMLSEETSQSWNIKSAGLFIEGSKKNKPIRTQICYELMAEKAFQEQTAA